MGFPHCLAVVLRLLLLGVLGDVFALEEYTRPGLAAVLVDLLHSLAAG